MFFILKFKFNLVLQNNSIWSFFYFDKLRINLVYHNLYIIFTHYNMQEIVIGMIIANNF